MTSGLFSENLTSFLRYSKTNFSLVVFLTLLFSSTYAQDIYGENPDECKQKLLILTTYYKQKTYENAEPSLRYLLQSCPKASKNIYIIGSVIFEEKLNSKKDSPLADAWLDTLLMLQDWRVKYFSPEEKNSYRAKKATYLLRFQTKTKYADAFAMLDSSFKEKASDLSLYEIQMYMYSNNLMVRSKQRSCSELASDYFAVTAYLNSLESSSSADQVKSKIGEYADICLSCESVDSLVLSEISFKKSDTTWIDNNIQLLSDKKCNSSAALVQLIEIRIISRPSADYAAALARYYSANKNNAKALSYYDQALSLSVGNVEQSNLLSEKARIYLSQGNYSKAFQTAKLSIGKNTNSDAYAIAGDAVASSASSCTNLTFGGKELLWLACDYYSLAIQYSDSEQQKNNLKGKISNYSVHFPANGELFMKSITEGTSYSIDCIFSEKTTVRAKKE